MTPERTFVDDGHRVEEYYWNGRMVVYIDNFLSDKSFEDACSSVKNISGVKP